MNLWCERKKGHGRKIDLTVCVATDCGKRAECAAYKAVSLEAESSAIAEVARQGHPLQVTRLPLLEPRKG